MKKLIECLSKIDEKAHITGVALIPRISRNNNLYTKKELERFDGLTVPLNWEHDSKNVIGKVTFHYNPELETVFYDGDITDEAYAALARTKQLYTSIEADVTAAQTVCNGPDDCFVMPFGLRPEALALTETPGVPETSVKVIEHILKKVSEVSIDDVIKVLIGDLESRIIAKFELLQAYDSLLKLDPTNQYYNDQLISCKDDLRWLIDQYVNLKTKMKENRKSKVDEIKIDFSDIPTLDKITQNLLEKNKHPKCPHCGGVKTSQIINHSQKSQ